MCPPKTLKRKKDNSTEGQEDTNDEMSLSNDTRLNQTIDMRLYLLTGYEISHLLFEIF